jgi:hypothetical protein
MSKLRNLIIYTASDWEHYPVLVTILCPHPTPRYGSRCSWTPKHLTHMSVLLHLYTISNSTRAYSQITGFGSAGSARDHQDKGFRPHIGTRIHHAKPIATWLPKFDKSCEPARLIGLRR